MKLNRARWAAVAAFVALTSGVVPIVHDGGLAAMQAQNLGQRVVAGGVVDAESAAVSSATVFLRNTKTKSIRSYTSGKDGRFRFAQVKMSDDYDVWAEKEGKKTAIKTVSSWDTRKEFECELKFK